MTTRNGIVGRGVNRLDSLKDSVKDLVDQGSEKVGAIRDRVMGAKDTAMSRGGEVVDRTTSLIKAHPFAAIGIAFGVGYILMRVFRR